MTVKKTDNTLKGVPEVTKSGINKKSQPAPLDGKVVVHTTNIVKDIITNALMGFVTVQSVAVYVGLYEERAEDWVVHAAYIYGFTYAAAMASLLLLKKLE